MNRDPELVAPWPIEELRRRLLEGDTLHVLTRPKQASGRHEVREVAFEALASDVMLGAFGGRSVATRRPIGDTLGLRASPFPSRAMPDIAVRHEGKVHILELKSSRTDYNRFDNVFDSQAFREYLRSVGDVGQVPWEVEQDLIKLRLYARLSDRVGSCLFVMVDAYTGPGRSWTAVFENPEAFRATMRTQLVRGWADELLQATDIEPLEHGDTKARLITCVVRPWTR